MLIGIKDVKKLNVHELVKISESRNRLLTDGYSVSKRIKRGRLLLIMLDRLLKYLCLRMKSITS